MDDAPPETAQRPQLSFYASLKHLIFAEFEAMTVSIQHGDGWSAELFRCDIRFSVQMALGQVTV